MRDTVIRMRVWGDEKARIEGKALEAGLSVSEYMRLVLLGVGDEQAGEAQVSDVGEAAFSAGDVSLVETGQEKAASERQHSPELTKLEGDRRFEAVGFRRSLECVTAKCARLKMACCDGCRELNE